jgi:hypothetical protein
VDNFWIKILPPPVLLPLGTCCALLVYHLFALFGAVSRATHPRTMHRRAAQLWAVWHSSLCVLIVLSLSWLLHLRRAVCP